MITIKLLHTILLVAVDKNSWWCDGGWERDDCRFSFIMHLYIIIIIELLKGSSHYTTFLCDIEHAGYLDHLAMGSKSGVQLQPIKTQDTVIIEISYGVLLI